LSILSSTLHVVFVGMHTGADLPVEKLVGVAAGVMLTILGVYLPLARPDRPVAARRGGAPPPAPAPAGPPAGGRTIVIALLWPWLTIFVAPAGVLVICAGIFVKALIAAFRS
jgi:hypothetical protein